MTYSMFGIFFKNFRPDVYLPVESLHSSFFTHTTGKSSSLYGYGLKFLICCQNYFYKNKRKRATFSPTPYSTQTKQNESRTCTLVRLCCAPIIRMIIIRYFNFFKKCWSVPFSRRYCYLNSPKKFGCFSLFFAPQPSGMSNFFLLEPSNQTLASDFCNEQSIYIKIYGGGAKKRETKSAPQGTNSL
jgi:hypothetical protein